MRKTDFSTAGWAIQNDNANGNTGLYMVVNTSGVSQGPCGFPSLTNILDGSWHHVVFVLNNGSCASYKDGAPGASGTYSVGDGFANSGSPLLISQINGGTNAAYDDVRIYNRALSPAEVKQLYNLGTVIVQPR
jgi:hypothetical protein